MHRSRYGLGINLNCWFSKDISAVVPVIEFKKTNNFYRLNQLSIVNFYRLRVEQGSHETIRWNRVMKLYLTALHRLMTVIWLGTLMRLNVHTTIRGQKTLEWVGGNAVGHGNFPNGAHFWFIWKAFVWTAWTWRPWIREILKGEDASSLSYQNTIWILETFQKTIGTGTWFTTQCKRYIVVFSSLFFGSITKYC